MITLLLIILAMIIVLSACLCIELMPWIIIVIAIYVVYRIIKKMIDENETKKKE